jgi:ankyrin repeat protein
MGYLACKLVDDEDFLENHIDLTEGPSVPGRTLLYYICQSKSIKKSEEREKAIRKLVSMGANVNFTDCDGGSILGVAFDNQKISTIKFLLDSGANVNHINKFRKSILCDAITNEDIEKIKLLLDYGADVNYINRHVHNPLVTAVFSNKINSVKLLLDYNVTPTILQRALRSAESRGYVDIANLIRSKM